jgi:hypothetical protein
MSKEAVRSWLLSRENTMLVMPCFVSESDVQARGCEEECVGMCMCACVRNGHLLVDCRQGAPFTHLQSDLSPATDKAKEATLAHT